MATLLIGIDGATWTVLDPYMESGVMPFLSELTERGTRAVLRSIMPPLTPPAWTSLVTGKHPGQHGIFDFFQKEEPGSVYFSFASSQEVRSATIWSLASEQERRIISLNFPLMFPAPPVEGAVVPGGMMPWRQLRLGCHPPGLFDRLKALPGFNPREMLDMELEIKAIDGCPEDEHAEFVELHIRREQRWAEVMRYLMQDEPGDLMAVMFDGVDKLQHLCWRFIDPACRPGQPDAWEQDMIELCERYFRSLDEQIRGIVELAGPDTTVVLASDHGFGPTQDVFHVNSWLEQQGYLTWAQPDSANGGAPGTNGRTDTDVGFAEMTRHVHALDWSRTVAYAATPSSQGINIVDRLPGSEDPMPDAARAKLAQDIADGLRAVERPFDGRPLVEEVWTREQAFSGPFEQLGPDLSLVLADGGTMSILPSETIVARRPQPRGHHRWEGIFLAAGPGICEGARVEELSIVDVAPLLLHQIGLPAPDDMSGSVPESIFQAGELERRPVRHAPAGPPAQLVTSPAAGVELAPEEQAALMERLRALGYVE
jgi:predicted AlkP superfamily phosphohydrolase/phosphomutase